MNFKEKKEEEKITGSSISSKKLKDIDESG